MTGGGRVRCPVCSTQHSAKAACPHSTLPAKNADPEKTRFLCNCGAEWVSPGHTRCEACGLTRTEYSVGYQAGWAGAWKRGRKQ